MFKKMMILGFCLMIVQPSLGMENTETQGLSRRKSETSEDLAEVNSTSLIFEETQKDAEEKIAKAALLLEESSRLGAEADRLTNEANRLADEARTSRGNILKIEHAYREAEKAYREAAQAHRIARTSELASGDADLASAKAVKALSKFPTISNIQSLRREYRNKVKEHKNLWILSISNAEAARSFELMLLSQAEGIRFERKKKVQLAQEFAPIHQKHSQITNSIERPLAPFGTKPMDIKSPDGYDLIVDEAIAAINDTLSPTFANSSVEKTIDEKRKK